MQDSDFLQLSGLQHFAFCRRQWALIHVEQQWAENYRTTDGAVMHEHAHDGAFRESRGTLHISRGMYIRSNTLGLSGQCDVVEFRQSPDGVPMPEWEGKWLPYPVEYKRGSPKVTDTDRLQLCAQAMCLEEMLCCQIPEGALYYGETRHREKVSFSPALRQQVAAMAAEMHELYRRGYTPKVRRTRSCNACSLNELCLPVLMKEPSVAEYLRKSMEDNQ